MGDMVGELMIFAISVFVNSTLFTMESSRVARLLTLCSFSSDTVSLRSST